MWEVLEKQTVVNHPFITVAMEKVRLPDGQVIPDWPQVYTRDYVNALVINEMGDALIIEGYKHGTGWSSWQVLGGYLEEGEDPLTAVKRELLEEAGYTSDTWYYLGSYVVDANRHIGVGHFFCARNARQIAAPLSGDLEEYTLKWIPLRELRQGLLDGRIAVVSYAITVALSMLTLNLKH